MSPWKEAGGNAPLRSAAFGVLAEATADVALGNRPRSTAVDVTGSAMLAIADRHRASAAVLRAMAMRLAPDDPSRQQLKAAADAKLRTGLKLAAELVRVSRALSSENVRHIVLKGPALAQRLYGDLAARDSKDIDIYIDPASRSRGEAVAKDLGYRPTSSPADGSPSPLWERLAPKDISFLHAERGVEIEMHSRLFDVDALIPRSFSTLWSARDIIVLSESEIPVLSTVDEFLFLCGHGAQCAWFRLKWLQDIARIVATSPPATRAALADASRRHGTGPMVNSALMLVEQLFGIPVPAEFVGAPRSAKAAARIVRASRRALAAPDPARLPSLRELASMTVLQLGLRDDRAYRLAVIERASLSRRDLASVSLPKWAQWLYYPLRPILFASRRLRRRSHGPTDRRV